MRWLNGIDTTNACNRTTVPAAAFTGLKVDVDRIRRDNEAKADAQRKAGLIIRSGRERYLCEFMRRVAHGAHHPVRVSAVLCGC